MFNLILQLLPFPLPLYSGPSDNGVCGSLRRRHRPVPPCLPPPAGTAFPLPAQGKPAIPPSVRSSYYGGLGLGGSDSASSTAVPSSISPSQQKRTRRRGRGRREGSCTSSPSASPSSASPSGLRCSPGDASSDAPPTSSSQSRRGLLNERLVVWPGD